MNAQGQTIPGITNGPDGLTIDPAGNIYSAVQNAVWAWNPQGQQLFELSFPEDPTNLDFGGADGRTLFVTAGTSLYSVQLNIVPEPAGIVLMVVGAVMVVMASQIGRWRHNRDQHTARYRWPAVSGMNVGSNFFQKRGVVMKTALLAVALLPLLAVSTAFAQSSELVEDFKPSSLNQPGQQYPQVNSQRYARFRIVAPDAQSVTVSLGARHQAYQRRGRRLDGHHGQIRWMKASTITISRLTAAHSTIPAPLNYYGSTRWESGIEIPAHDQDFYAVKDVPHGRVQQVLFPSKSTNTVTSAPPSFIRRPITTRTRRSAYPVLYLQHGWGEDEYCLVEPRPRQSDHGQPDRRG